MANPTKPEGASTDLEEQIPDELVLAADFQSPSYEQWGKEVAKVLNRGRPEDKQLTPEQALSRLRIRTVDGLVIEPIYTKEDSIGTIGAPAMMPFTRGTTIKDGSMNAWDMRALHEDPDSSFTRKAIDTDLERGATSIWLRVDPDAIKVADIKNDLADVLLDLAKVEVSSRYDQQAAANALLELYESSDIDKSKLSLNLGIDPIGFAAMHGTEPDLKDLSQWAKRLFGYLKSRAYMVEGAVYHNAGAGDIHEVAWLIATAVEYVRTLVDEGLSVDQAFDSINFRVTATTDQVATIARLRALRMMWSRVGEIFEVSHEKRGARQHAVLSWREITRDDPYVNILRGSIATFSAAVGGAESITVLPFDTAWGLPNDFSRRIARNTQVVLCEESNIGRVNDPAGGAWYIESLTRQIAEKAWEAFQEVEASGGMVAYLKAGKVAEKLAELNSERAKRIDTRKQPITGVSEFPNPSEKPLDAKPRPQAPELKGLAWHRDSEPFENLRDLTKGTDASVFLACLGTRRDYGPREGFASNYFHIAGLETPETEGLEVDKLIAAWKEQAAATPVVCLCSSGKVYAEHGYEFAKAFKDAGAKTVLLAGNIKELGDVDADSVIDGTIALGKDVVAGLHEILKTLGVEK